MKWEKIAGPLSHIQTFRALVPEENPSGYLYLMTAGPVSITTTYIPFGPELATSPENMMFSSSKSKNLNIIDLDDYINKVTDRVLS